MPVNPREPKPRTKILVRVVDGDKLAVWTTNVAIYARAKMDGMRFGSIQAGTQATTDSSTMLIMHVNPCYSFDDVALWLARGGVLVNSDGANLKVNDDASIE